MQAMVLKKLKTALEWTAIGIIAFGQLIFASAQKQAAPSHSLQLKSAAAVLQGRRGLRKNTYVAAINSISKETPT